MASPRAADRLSAPGGEPFEEARVIVLGAAAREPMRELDLAVQASIDPGPGRAARVASRLSRPAFVVSVVAHVVAGYALSRQVWSGAAVPATPTAEFFLFEIPRERPREAVPVTPPVEQAPEVSEAREPAPAPAPPAPQPAPEPAVVVEPPAAIEPEPTPEVPPAPTPRAYIDFDEERRRAANQVIGSRTEENEALTFSTNDLGPRPDAEREQKRSIFDGTGEPIGPRVGTVGQARTKFGHRVSALCNALTGGFSLMGFGSFCAPPPDGGPSGLFPEVRPAYLDLMPECVDTRDTAPALALEAPFPTVKCRLVKQEDVGEEP